MKGKITQWNDDKGFWIYYARRWFRKTFFSYLPSPKDRRPQINDEVLFETETDSQRTSESYRSLLMKVGLRPITQPSKQSHRARGVKDKKIILEPVRKTPLIMFFNPGYSFDNVSWF